MIKDSQIVFLTTTLFSDCLELQKSTIKGNFPESEHILIDGTEKLDWPNSIFFWLDRLKGRTEKYFILIDEDCFITNKQEILNTLSLLENQTFDILGCSDGYHPFRTCNPIAMNPFLLFGRVSDFTNFDINFSKLKYKIKNLPGLFVKGQHHQWTNSAGIKYKHSYRESFFYPHPILSESNFQDGKEPYYCLFWYLKDKGLRFGYLYPHMDKDLVTTNPKINESSPEMAIHVWESRNMNSSSKLFGKTARQRFELVKNYLSNLNI